MRSGTGSSPGLNAVFLSTQFTLKFSDCSLTLTISFLHKPLAIRDGQNNEKGSLVTNFSPKASHPVYLTKAMI